MIKKLIAATCYGDALMRITNRIRPYEKDPGSTNIFFNYRLSISKDSVAHFNFREYKKNLEKMVEQFDLLPVIPKRKPKVGVVGEILVKFHPNANNQIVELIEQEGGEAVLPDILDFFLYCSYDGIYKGKHLGKSKLSVPVRHSIIRYLEYFRKPLKDALRKSERFSEPLTIYQLADKAGKLLSIANQAGEGWFLTAEMMELIEDGVDNIACVQPFAWLPNHVTGRGMMKGLKEMYPHANITAIDYDASETAINQVNRLKLMLATAFKNIENNRYASNSVTVEQDIKVVESINWT